MLTIEKEKLELTTSDMWKIALYHYHGHKITRKTPVLLVHGIASDSTTWDIGVEGYNFAPWLASQGFDVYSIDLRGRSGSDGPHTGRGNQWSIDDYLLCDLPCAVEYILETTGSKNLHWVGHSLGGILGFFYQIRHKAANIKSLTGFAAALTYSYSTINHFRTWLDYITVLPYFPIDQLWRPLKAFVNENTPWNRFLWNPDNLTPEVKNAVMDKTVQRIAVLEWNQIKTISAVEGMTRLSGVFNHYVYDRRIVAPTLLLAGDKDWVCALEGIEWTTTNLKCRNRHMIFGKEYGSKASYGHMDIVCGINAPEETWPAALDWIVANED